MPAFGGKALQRATKYNVLLSSQLVIRTPLPEKAAGEAPGKHGETSVMSPSALALGRFDRVTPLWRISPDRVDLYFCVLPARHRTAYRCLITDNEMASAAERHACAP